MINDTASSPVGSKDESSLSLSQKVAYSLPLIPCHILMVPMAILQGVYAKHYGLALTTLALIVFSGRIFDAVTDPLVGYCSDRYHAKHGTRKPFIFVGGLLLIICGFFLYAPLGEVTTLYFAVWYILFFGAFTLIDIPHVTWPCDMTSNQDERAKLYSARVVTTYVAYTIFYSVPLLPFFESKEVTPQTLNTTYFIALILALPFFGYCLRTVPSGVPSLPQREPTATPPFSKLGLFIKELISNKPFLWVILAYIFAVFGSSMWYALIFSYVDAYLGMGDQFAQLFLVSFLIGIAVPSLWYGVAVKLGKKNTWMLASILMIISFLLTALIEPGNTSFIQLLVIKVLVTCSFAGTGILLPTMVSGCIDYNRWKNNNDNSAIYFSIQIFASKSCGALGIAAALAIAGWFGVDVTATEHSEESILGLKIAMVYMPIFVSLISLVLILFYPLNEKRHAIIRKRLDQRAQRLANAAQS